MACAPNSQLSRGGLKLLDSLPDDNGESRLWLRAQYYSNVKEASVKDQDGDSYMVMAGADTTAGAQDEWALGGAVAYLRTQTEAAFPPLATFDLKTDGVGPVGYVRYTPYKSTNGDTQVWMRAQGGYLFLHNGSKTTTRGVPYQSSERGGGLFVGDLSLAFAQKISRDGDDFIRGAAGVRVANTHYDDPLMQSRKDTLLYARTSIDYEFAYKWRVTAGIGADIPLDHYSLGVVAAGSSDAARDVNFFFDYEVGIRHAASDRVMLTLGLIGSQASDFHELGGMFRIRYTFDKRVRN